MGGVAGIATLVAVSAVPAAATGNTDGPTGSAFAAKAEVTALNAIKLDVPELPLAHYPKGADKSVVKGDIPPVTGDVVSFKVLNGASNLDAGKLASEASLADVKVLKDVIHVEVLKADCTADATGLHGSSVITRLTVKGDV